MIFRYIQKLRDKDPSERAVYTFFWSSFFTGIFVFFQFFTPYINFDKYFNTITEYNTKDSESINTEISKNSSEKSILEEIKTTYSQLKNNISDIQKVNLSTSLDNDESLNSLDKITFNIKGVDFNTYIADNNEKRTMGLSGSKQLCTNCALLFVFDNPQILSFWMKDMNYNIDIVFLDELGKVINIYENLDPKTYPQSFVSTSLSKYALEINANLSKSLGLEIGDNLYLPDIKSKD